MLPERSRSGPEARRKLSNQLLDAEQHGALTHLVQAREMVAHKQDPAAVMEQMKAALAACFAMAAQDVVCQTLAAQAEWVAADWQAGQKQPNKEKEKESLKAALAKAQLATQSPEPYPDAWQTLAETHLRLARGTADPQRAQHIEQGLLAVQKLFAINPHHAQGLATQGELLLLRSQSESDRGTPGGSFK